MRCNHTLGRLLAPPVHRRAAAVPVQYPQEAKQPHHERRKFLLIEHLENKVVQLRENADQAPLTSAAATAGAAAPKWVQSRERLRNLLDRSSKS